MCLQEDRDGDVYHCSYWVAKEYREQEMQKPTKILAVPQASDAGSFDSINSEKMVFY